MYLRSDNPKELFAAHQTHHMVRGQFWNVFETGKGTPIVFLHNGGGSLWNWSHQLEYFFSNFRVIAPDLPGFGRSHRPAKPLTLTSYVQDLSKLLEALNCPNPILVGNCIGASIALEFAMQHPDRVSALALFNVCGGIPMLNRRMQYWAALRPTSSTGRALHRYMIASTSHPAMQRFNAHMIYANGEPVLHPMLGQFIRQQHLDPSLRPSLYWLVMGLNSFNIFSQLRQKPASLPPILLGWGSKNRTLAVKWSKLIAEWLMPDEFHLIKDAGHMPMYEQPDLINKLLEVFFEKHASRAAFNKPHAYNIEDPILHLTRMEVP